jgi:hypothetical protein
MTKPVIVATARATRPCAEAIIRFWVGQIVTQTPKPPTTAPPIMARIIFVVLLIFRFLRFVVPCLDVENNL